MYIELWDDLFSKFGAEVGGPTKFLGIPYFCPTPWISMTGRPLARS